MNAIKNLKPWLIIALLAALLASMLIIIKHYNAENNQPEWIYNHSEIKDTI